MEISADDLKDVVMSLKSKFEYDEESEKKCDLAQDRMKEVLRPILNDIVNDKDTEKKNLSFLTLGALSSLYEDVFLERIERCDNNKDKKRFMNLFFGEIRALKDLRECFKD